MFGLFKSAKQKQDEANFRLVAKGIYDLGRQNLLGISHADTQFDAGQRQSVAEGIFMAPLEFDRTQAGINELEKVIRRIDTETKIKNDNLRAEYSFGLMLSYRMMAASSLMLRVNDSYWIELATLMSQIEGPLHAFLKRTNFGVWPVKYVEDFAFEQYRKKFFEK